MHAYFKIRILCISILPQQLLFLNACYICTVSLIFHISTISCEDRKSTILSRCGDMSKKTVNKVLDHMGKKDAVFPFGYQLDGQNIQKYIFYKFLTGSVFFDINRCISKIEKFEEIPDFPRKDDILEDIRTKFPIGTHINKLLLCRVSKLQFSKKLKALSIFPFQI